MGNDREWGTGDWSFKDPNAKKPEIKKYKPAKKRKKNKKDRFKNKPIKGFYGSEEWRKLRYRVLRKYSATCMCCGRNYRKHGVIIHVDHIKPRSKFPHLELCFDNLQVLCEDCNIGKGARDDTDWRPSEDEITEFLDELTLQSSPL